MAENDIYNSRGRYESFKANLKDFLIKPENKQNGWQRQAKYHCQNPVNLKYFEKLFSLWDAKDISFVRRLRLITTFKLICFATKKDLATLQRDDINVILKLAHENNRTPKSKSDFIRDTKHLWRLLFPDADEKGRPDETITPYVVRHLSGKIDKSREKKRKDKLSWEEYDNLINFFANDPLMQCFLTLSLESLGRPQEILHIRLNDVENKDNYAKVYLPEKTKEGIGLLQCIDSHPYLTSWLKCHPQQSNKTAYLFINSSGGQLTPYTINKKLRKACRACQIDKPITCYSMKRNGVTMRRLRGQSDLEIQHAARWKSSKQLQTYDLSQQEEAFQIELIKKGVIKSDEKHKHLQPTNRKCEYCQTTNGYTAELCTNCKRPLDRLRILEEVEKKDREVIELREKIIKLERLEARIEKNEKHFEIIANYLSQPKIAEDLKRFAYKKLN